MPRIVRADICHECEKLDLEVCNGMKHWVPNCSQFEQVSPRKSRIIKNKKGVEGC